MPSQDPVFDSAFQTRLLHPRYWLSWLALGVLGVLAYVPPRLRDKLADALAPLVLKISKKQVYIARTNLAICFKEQSEAERDAILMTSIRVGLKSLLGFGEFTVRSPEYLMKRIQVSGWEHIDAEQAAGRPVILVVPHSWPIDAAGYYFSQRGLPMFYERSAGIKPVIKAVKSGLSFFYLPDQDHGREASLFVPFFKHPKATLPALPRLVKLTGARAVPVLACYDEAAHCYRLEIEAPFADYPSDEGKTASMKRAYVASARDSALIPEPQLDVHFQVAPCGPLFISN